MSKRCGFSVGKLVFTILFSCALASVASKPASSQLTVKAALPHGAALQFGMNAGQVSQVLGVRLTYVRGRPGNELYLAIPNVKGSALSIRSDGLYLQFRKGRLSGWKGDWGTIRP
jgi:hypothetical protein